MYESFFGLRERPFDLAPNPRYLFLSAPQREALSTLRYALSGPRGLALLVGEAGTGKTTLAMTALGEMGSDVQCVLLSNPTLTRAEFYEFLADAFGLGAEAAQSKTRFLFALRQHVEQRHARGQLTALMIDEAQSLPDELLEEVRLLSNIETTTTKLLSVVLAGQPELAARLNEPHLRQLKQRVALRCELSVFDLPETAAYIAGRLRLAGGTPANVFTRNAIEAIHRGSAGVPRTINVICENALIGGFAAQLKPIVRAMVEEVLRDFDLRSESDEPPLDDPLPSADTGETREDAKTPVPDGAVDPSSAEADAPVPVRFGMFGRKKGFSFF